MTFKKHHKTYPKRTKNEIQELIIEALERFPRSTYAISRAIKADAKTVLHNLEQLKEFDRVKEVDIKYRKDVASRYWALRPV